MKVSLNWAQYHSNVDINSVGTDEILKLIGAQLGEVEEVEYWGKKYDGIVVAKVISCDKHPDADKLSLCRIDDSGVVQGVDRGEDGLVQVVCGAPNAQAGLTVAWIPPGVVIPSTLAKDPLLLEAREIRGKISNGMLASPAELGISDNQDGILEINESEVGADQAKPGTYFNKLYGNDDVVIDIENKMFTHRPDCFGILGVARELAGIQGLEFKSPDWYSKREKLTNGNSLPLEVRVDDPELVPRFMAVAMSDVKVGSSPVWMQAGLTRVGIKPINNIVDLTNYYSQLTGQPLHAYDYNKVAKLSENTPTLVARQAETDDKIVLLNGKTVGFDAPTIVIATDKEPIGVGGVMGGSDTEVDENTTNIILECANFDMYNIRRTSMKYGLFTDAVTRFTKGQSVYQNDRILAKIMSDIVEQCGGKQASEVIDIHSGLPEMQKVTVSMDFINSRLGSGLSAQEIKQLLENVEFVVDISGDDLVVDFPFWRTDIEIPEDVVEEVGRLYGYDKLPVQLPKRDLTPVDKDLIQTTKQTIREILSRAGANEVLTYNFVHGELLDKVGQDRGLAYKLSNALSPDLQYYRLSLLPSLLDKVHLNIKSGHNEFGIFEINKSHCNDYLGEDGLPVEEQRLAFVFTADDKLDKAKNSGAAYFQAKTYALYLLNELGISSIFTSASGHNPKLNVSKQAFAPFEPSRTAIIHDTNGEFIGEVGEFKSSVRRKLKLPQFVSGFELDVSQLTKLAKPNQYTPLSRFPNTDQDISLQVTADTSYHKVLEAVKEPLDTETNEHGYVTQIEPVDIYQPNDLDRKNITFRITLTHHNRTLVTQEVNNVMSRIEESVKKSLGAIRL